MKASTAKSVFASLLILTMLLSAAAFGGAAAYADGLPDSVSTRVNSRWMDFFRIYYRHRAQISRVTLWGLTDGSSWLNDWPIKGRTNYGLLFDRNYQPKPCVADIIRLFSK